MKDMDVFQELRDCKYTILDQRKLLKPELVQLQIKYYTFWQTYWDNILNSVGIKQTLDPIEFFQQSKATVITRGDEIVCMHMLSIYDRKDIHHHPYFSKFDQGFKNAIASQNLERILTLQYLALNPEYKKEKPYIYFPMVIGSLSVLHQEIERAQATISVARKDLGISNALLKMNFHQFQNDGVFNNTPVSYQISTQPKIYPSPLVEKYALHFWNNRIELSERINVNKEVA